MEGTKATCSLLASMWSMPVVAWQWSFYTVPITYTYVSGAGIMFGTFLLPEHPCAHGSFGFPNIVLIAHDCTHRILNVPE